MQHQLDGFKPKSNWCEYFALIWICEDTLFNAVFGKVCIKVDLGLVNKFEVRTDDDS